MLESKNKIVKRSNRRLVSVEDCRQIKTGNTQGSPSNSQANPPTLPEEALRRF